MFHQGLDGLVVGLALVFVVRVEMVFSSLVNWWAVPRWTYAPIETSISGVIGWLRDADAFLAIYVRVGGSDGTSGALLGELGSAAVKVVGLPVSLTGALSASAVEQLLIVVGFWIAVLVPLWCWGIRPFYFWWRHGV